MLTKNLHKWKSIREIDVSYNNLDIRSVRLVSHLMRENYSITRFEMAPLLDVELSEEEDLRLEKYFNDLDNMCYRNFLRIMSKKSNNPTDPSQTFNIQGISSTVSTPKASNTPEIKDSPSSIMIQRRHSVELLNLQCEITQTVEILDTYDNISSRLSHNENERIVLHVITYYLIVATFSRTPILQSQAREI